MGAFGIRQHDIRDCGAACLASICKYYGLNIPLAKVREYMKVDKNGSSIYSITKVAEYFALKTSVLQGTFDELIVGIRNKELKLPLIAHLDCENYGHYIIIRKISSQKIKVFDPSKGNCIWGVDDFCGKWTGYIILIEKGESFQQKNLCKDELKKYFNIFKQEKWTLFQILVISLFLTIIMLVSALSYQRIIDEFILRKETQEIFYKSDIKFLNKLIEGINSIVNEFHYFFCALVGLYFVQMFLNIIRGMAIAKISNRINQKLIDKFVKKVLFLPINFFKDRETGEILSRFSDIGEIKQFLAEGGVTIVINIFMVFTGAYILVSINTWMFFGVLLIIILYALIVLVFKSQIYTVKQNIFEENSQLITKLKESIDNIESVRNLCREEKEYGILSQKNANVLNYLYKGEVISKVQSALLENIEGIGALCILWFGSFLVIHGKLSLGDLISFQSLMRFFIEPFRQLIELQLQVQGALIAMDRLNDVLDICSEDEIYIGTEKPNFKNSNLVFKNVEFGYNFDNVVLHNIDLNLKSGKKYAIVGKSGSGKSTLMRLLVQHYKYEQGKIYVGNSELNNISLKYLRSKVKFVSSEGKLFAGSILENLLNSKELDKKKVEEVIIGCKLESLLSELPFGIETRISEGGSELSSGQRQRIFLAQALLENPEVLILDEGTSHLDESSEREVFNFIKVYCKDITCIFILHNLILAAECDEIIVMENGKVIEYGSKNSLLKKNGLYKQMLCGEKCDKLYYKGNIV